MDQVINPRVFISYCWEPIENKVKTISLAEKLVSNGVDVILDVWDLKEGQDKYKFMEKMVNSPEISRVLIICNEKYKEKADQRKGGVGSESMIISEGVYSNAEQIKFIPVIFEKNEEGKPYLPTYVSSCIYIDLSDDEFYEIEYEKLLRNIFEKPLYKKPKLGNPPNLLNNNGNLTQNFAKINEVKNALINEKSFVDELIKDYFERFFEILNEKEVDINNPANIDEIILQKIDDLKWLKNEFIDLLKVISRFGRHKISMFHKFFEQGFEFLLAHTNFNYPSGTVGSMKNDHFYFLINELFLSISCYLLEKEFYDELAEILHKPYSVYNKSNKDYVSLRYVYFCFVIPSLSSFRNERLRLNAVNGTSKLLIDRSKGLFKNDYSIQDADKMLYYTSCLTADNGFNSRLWIPFTCTSSESEFVLFKMLKSQTQFDKFKKVLNVNSKEELIDRFNNAVINRLDERIDRFSYSLEPLDTLIIPTKLCSIP